MEPIKNCCACFHLCNRSRRSGKPTAAAGTERGDCLSAEIISIKKGIQDSRHISPPDREFFCQVGTKKISFFCFHYILKSHNRELHKLLCSNNLKVITFETPRIINEQNTKLCSFIINHIKNPTHFLGNIAPIIVSG